MQSNCCTMDLLLIATVFMNYFVGFEYALDDNKVALFSRQTLFDDHIFNGAYLFNISSKSSVDCGRKCLETNGCVSYFYNKITKLCFTLDTILPDTASLTSAQNWKYYTDIKGESTTVLTTVPVTTTEVITTTVTTVTTASAVTCPSDYTTTATERLCVKYYGKSGTARTYAEIQNVCANDGGALVKIDSAAKQADLKSYLEGFITDTNIRIRIQGQQDITDGYTWYYDDGTTFTYYEWSPSQPNDVGDRCVAVRHSSYLWKDINCLYDSALVCQIITS